VREDALRVADGGHDAGDNVVEQVERCVRSKGTVVSFRPETRAGGGVDEMCRDTNLRSGLPDAAFHHIACA